MLWMFATGAQPPGESEPSRAATPPTSAPASSGRTVAPLALLPSLIEAELRLERAHLPVGNPVVAEFIIRNKTSDPVTLQVPGTDVGYQPLLGMGLPLEHVFSSERFTALRVVTDGNPSLGDRKELKPDYPVPLVTLAPFASVGLKFDIARFYPFLHQAGRYELNWAPYSGAIVAPPVSLEVTTYKVVILETTYGKLTLRLLYDKAPKTVAEFVELVSSRFYNDKAFHRVEPNFVIAGGCPRGDGTGRRPDGRTLESEFNDTPFDVGTIGMSLADGDPHSASCQFFIALARLPFLDGKYTAFAQIEGPESLETLRRLGSVETDAKKRPLKPLVIKSATAMDAPPTR